jgi:hypothetical protein
MEFLKNKTVCFVAQTPILEGRKRGQKIDTFDFVFRSNLYPIENTVDFGSRCDIIAATQDHFRFLKDHEVPHVVHYDYLRGYKKYVKDRNSYLINTRERKALRTWCMTTFGVDIIDATNGLMAWWLSYIHGASQIRMFGFTGYQDHKGNIVNHGVKKHYTDEFVERLGVREYNESVQMAQYDCHDFAAINYVWRKLLELKMVEFDYFSLKYFH